MNPTEVKTKEFASATTIIPEVDVQANQDGVCLKMDLPGVDKEHLTINLEKQTLSIQGEIVQDTTSAFVIDELLGKRYEQSFTLSSELDTDRIVASFQDGVLTLTLPKKESLKPRKIEIKE